MNNSFGEYSQNKIKYYSHPVEFFEEQVKNNLSYYEILPEIVKPFFDIENVQNIKQIDIILKILLDNFQKYFGYEPKEYVLTHNDHSCNHEGHSFHLIFCDCVISQYHLKNFVLNLLTDSDNESNKDYSLLKNTIDPVVYTTNRLFRTVDSYGITKTNQKDFNSIHKIYKSKTIKDPKILSIISFIDGIDKRLKPIVEIPVKNKIKKVKGYSINTITKKITEELSEEFDKKINGIVLKEKMKENELNDNDLNDKILVLLEFPLKEVSKNKLNELKEYYSLNKTFKGFRLNIKQIDYLLKLIEKELN